MNPIALMTRIEIIKKPRLTDSSSPMRFSHLTYPILLCLFLVASPRAVAENPKTLARHFFRSPAMENVKISPGNRYLSFIGDRGDQSLQSYEFETGRRRATRAEKGDVYDYYWVSSKQVLVFAQRLGIPSQIFSVTDRLGQPNPTDYVEVYDLLPDTRDTFIVKNTDRSEKFFDLDRYDLSNQGRRRVAKNPGHIISWFTDKDGVIRIRLWVDENEDDRFDYRKDADSPWTEIHPGADSFGILFLNEPEKVIAFVRPEGESKVIGRYFDCARNEAYGEPIADPEYDVLPDFYVLDPESEETFGFSYQAKRRKAIWLSEPHQALQAQVDAQYPDSNNEIHGFAMDDSQAVIRRSSDRHPGEWLLRDVESRSEVSIGLERPWIDPEATAKVESIVFPNRHGQSIHALLTRPSAPPDEKKLIAMIHGGPRARDYWGWDSEAQFFASLGYTVMKINYRGSSEYGLDYSPYAHLDAIRNSIVDVGDGVRWAIDQGYADPSKVAIYGSSFGGHVALRAAAENPDLFACVIGYAGVYDWVKEMDREFAKEPVFWKLKMRTYYGDYENEKDLWADASAIALVDQIDAPVYLLHGGADQIVASRQSKLMRTALKKAGKDVTLKILSFNNHGMVSEAPTIRFYQNLAKFVEDSMQMR